jgi:hypothetical protein
MSTEATYAGLFREADELATKYVDYGRRLAEGDDEAYRLLDEEQPDALRETLNLADYGGEFLGRIFERLTALVGAVKAEFYERREYGVEIDDLDLGEISSWAFAYADDDLDLDEIPARDGAILAMNAEEFVNIALLAQAMTERYTIRYTVPSSDSDRPEVRDGMRALGFVETEPGVFRRRDAGVAE